MTKQTVTPWHTNIVSPRHSYLAAGPVPPAVTAENGVVTSEFIDWVVESTRADLNGGKIIANFYGADAAANAEYVAHAVNCHEVLVETLAALQIGLASILKDGNLAYVPAMVLLAEKAGRLANAE